MVFPFLILKTNMKLLAERGVKVFFTQVFRDSFFHADMHPGNVFISYDHPENPYYIGIDCGIVGSLNKEDKRYLIISLISTILNIVLSIILVVLMKNNKYMGRRHKNKV